MKLFGTRQRHRPDDPIALAAIPAGGGSAATPARFSDPVAQAMHPRAADAIWFGGMTFRCDRGRVAE
jgi:hypothetical protein